MLHDWRRWLERLLVARKPTGSKGLEATSRVEAPPTGSTPVKAHHDHTTVPHELLADLERHRGEWRT